MIELEGVDTLTLHQNSTHKRERDFHSWRGEGFAERDRTATAIARVKE